MTIAALFSDILPTSAILTTPAACAPYVAEQRNYFTSNAAAVLLPRSTSEVAAVVECAARHGIAIIPQGGNTGLVGGSVATTEQVIVNLQQVNAIRAVYADDGLLVAEAGVTLRAINDVAATHGLRCPLGLSVADTCQLGGIIATNAGGVQALRHGTMRQLVNGIEGVLANGRIVSELALVRKSNYGFDAKQLFIGTEGTLGIITAAVVKLVPLAKQTASILHPCQSIAEAIAVFRSARNHFHESVEACELISAAALQLASRFSRQPIANLPAAPWYVLLQCTSQQVTPSLVTHLQQIFPQSLIDDAHQQQHWWHIRSQIPWAQRPEGVCLKHDIAVPLSTLPAFEQAARDAITTLHPNARLIVFGHMGDGNLHYNILQASQNNGVSLKQQQPAIEAAIYRLVLAHYGSLSAEHGIGLAKKSLLPKALSAESIHVRQEIKHALDPHNLFNPGKIL